VSHRNVRSHCSLIPRICYASWSGSLLILLVFLAGCEKKPPSTNQIQTITSDLVAVAHQAAGREAQIVIQPEMGRLGGGPSRLVADDIFIQLSAASERGAVEQALNRAAARHHLTPTPRASSPSVVRFDYSLNGTRTQTIHIILPGSAASKSAYAGNAASGPRLAVIIDDLGADPAPAETILNWPFPLTLSVLPHELHSGDIAEEAFRHGDQVILHLPMEAESDAAKPEAIELRVGMSANQVDSLISGMLETVPHAIGVNNHEGSRATANAQLMGEVMAVLHERNLFFVDSRTTSATVAYDVAKQDGVPAAYRKVFLDDVETHEAVLQQLDLAARDAMNQGWAIAIGHPHPVTFAALAEGLPKVQQQGVHLVFVSSLVQ
jgi:polysaccharide deacetylase 2 family uncharacterized protein YibQ